MAKKTKKRVRNLSTGRDYSGQKKYNAKPSEIARRVRNNRANRQAGTYGNGDGKDIAHTKPNAMGKTFKQAASKNRSFARTKNAGRKK